MIDPIVNKTINTIDIMIPIIQTNPFVNNKKINNGIIQNTPSTIFTSKPIPTLILCFTISVSLCQSSLGNIKLTNKPDTEIKSANRLVRIIYPSVYITPSNPASIINLIPKKTEDIKIQIHTTIKLQRILLVNTFL